MYATLYASSSFTSSFIIFAILSWCVSILCAATIACLFPLAPAWANPLKLPTTTTLSPAITSAPSFTSPNTIKVPSYSKRCPDLNDPLWILDSEISTSLLYVLRISFSPKALGVSNSTSTLILFLIKSWISFNSLFFRILPVTNIGVFSCWYNFLSSGTVSYTHLTLPTIA